jgi:hypothetical protein
MFRFISLTMIGLAATGLILATPSASQAQVGVNVRVGPVGVSAGVPVYPAVAPYPVYVAPPVAVAPVPVAVVAPPVPVVAPYPVGPSVVVRAPIWFGPHHFHGHYYYRHHR